MSCGNPTTSSSVKGVLDLTFLDLNQFETAFIQQLQLQQQIAAKSNGSSSPKSPSSTKNTNNKDMDIITLVSKTYTNEDLNKLLTEKYELTLKYEDKSKTQMKTLTSSSSSSTTRPLSPDKKPNSATTTTSTTSLNLNTNTGTVIIDDKLRSNPNSILSLETLDINNTSESSSSSSLGLFINPFSNHIKAIRIANNNLKYYEFILYTLIQLRFINPIEILWLDLSYNIIETMPSYHFFQTFPNLTTIYLQANHISKLSGVKILSNITCLKTLSLYGNPIEELKHYRNYVLSHCPTLTQLDSSVVTKSDRVKVPFVFSAGTDHWIEIHWQKLDASGFQSSGFLNPACVRKTCWIK